MNKNKSLKQAASKKYTYLQDQEIFIAGTKHQKELSDAREKLLMDVISEMQNTLKAIASAYPQVGDLATYPELSEITLSSVAKKLEGL